MTNEENLLAQVSANHLWETNQAIAQWVRHSGTEEEREAFAYVQQTLQDYGLATTLLEHPALVSYPLDSSLEIVDGNGHAMVAYPTLGTAYSATVDALEAEVVDLQYGTEDDYAHSDVQGKFVLLNGLATPTAVFAAEAAGAIGQIFINDDHHHYMIVSTIWGTPTPQSAQRIPFTPSLSLVEADGHDLRARIAQGPVRLRLSTEVFMDWQQTPILVAELAGTESDEFVLFSGHLDSWEVGAMDNGSANATMMEVARLLAKNKKRLFRGVRLCFWSGHSHGRYSGSAWYADHHWEDLYDHCVAHVNVDSTGARGATDYSGFAANLELRSLGRQVIQAQTGQDSKARRMSRAGDMSFNGIGIPALFMTLSHVPLTEDSLNYVTEAAGKLLGSALPWWWHSSEDTMDKVDRDVLVLDTQIYLSTLWRLCTVALLPMDFRPVVQDIVATLNQLQDAVGESLDLSKSMQRANALLEHITKLTQTRDQLTEQTEQPVDQIRCLNDQQKALSRILIPITYTEAGRFDHDPAWTIPHIPLLSDAPKLAQLSPESDEFLFLQTQLIRNRNAVNFALRQAIEVFGS